MEQNKKKVVAFLQNAWSPFYAGRTWPRSSWLLALHKSRSGHRLRVLGNSCNGCEIYYDNTTPIVGVSPSSIIEPDNEHVKTVIETEKPDIILTLGKQSAKTIIELNPDKPILMIPHPAHRIVTNNLYKMAGEIICEGFEGIIELKQEKGKVNVIKHKES